MTAYNVTYYYLSAGKTRPPVTRDHGVVFAESAAAAKEQVMQREYPDKASYAFNLSCLSAFQ